MTAQDLVTLLISTIIALFVFYLHELSQVHTNLHHIHKLRLYFVRGIILMMRDLLISLGSHVASENEETRNHLRLSMNHKRLFVYTEE